MHAEPHGSSGGGSRAVTNPAPKRPRLRSRGEPLQATGMSLSISEIVQGIRHGPMAASRMEIHACACACPPRTTPPPPHLDAVLAAQLAVGLAVAVHSHKRHDALQQWMLMMVERSEAQQLSPATRHGTRQAAAPTRPKDIVAPAASQRRWSRQGPGSCSGHTTAQRTPAAAVRQEAGWAGTEGSVGGGGGGGRLGWRSSPA